ncbi:MAG: hypothetical protein Q9170_004903, partial [Blastenia crenularia]
MELYRQFQEVCASGDLTKVAEIVDSEPRSQEYLNAGLRFAIYKADIRIVEFLLRKVETINADIARAAIEARSIPIFQMLLDHGWDINAPVLAGSTMVTRVLDDEKLVRWSLAHGAQPDLPVGSYKLNAAYESPMTSGDCINIAASKSSIVVLDLLFEHGATKGDGIPLHMAANNGTGDERISMMAHLLDLGYDVNAVAFGEVRNDAAGGRYAIGTPLHYAVTAQSLAKLEFLLQKGSDPHLSVGQRGSAFALAESMGLVDFVGLMERYSPQAVGSLH